MVTFSLTCKLGPNLPSFGEHSGHRGMMRVTGTGRVLESCGRGSGQRNLLGREYEDQPDGENLRSRGPDKIDL